MCCANPHLFLSSLTHARPAAAAARSMLYDSAPPTLLAITFESFLAAASLSRS